MENTIENATAFLDELSDAFPKMRFSQAMVEYAASVRPVVVVPSEAESIVTTLAEWSLAYPRDRVYHMSKMAMDNELIALEERAKKYFAKSKSLTFTELNNEK